MSGYVHRMMAQHVGRSFTAQPAILFLLVHALVAQLANNGNNVLVTSSEIIEAVAHDSGVDKEYDGMSFLIHNAQTTVYSARIITVPELLALSVPVKFSTDLLFIEFRGSGLNRSNVVLRWSLWPRDKCPHHPDNTLDVAWISPAANYGVYQFRTKPDLSVTRVYFCLKNGTNEAWRNLGEHISIKYPIYE